MTDPSRGVERFLAELRRRRVVGAAVVYVLVAWALIQVSDIAFPALHLPPWSVTLVVALTIIAFPLVLVLAWVFELTADGIRKTRGTVHPGPDSPQGRWRFTWLLVALAGIVVIGGTVAVRGPIGGDGAGDDTVVKSIAVLPLSSLASDEENAYFADGIHEDILTRLAKVGGLKVISRTSVLPYREGAGRNLREIGRELGVATILEGSVRRSGNRVLVTAQLIDARTDEHLWADSYDRDLTDVFGIQAAIAEEIVHALRVRLTPEERRRIERRATRDPEAYDAFLQGREFEHRASGLSYEEMAEAERMYRRAVERDPAFALAWAWLSMAHSRIHWFAWDRSPERVQAAQDAAERSLEADPGLPEGHLALGLVHYRLHWDYDQAARELEIARRGLPGSSDVHAAIGWVQRRRGHFDDAIASLERAVELDPRNGAHHLQLAFGYRLVRRYEDAKRSLGISLALAPDDYAAALQAGYFFLSREGTTDTLKTVLERFRHRTDPNGSIPRALFDVAMIEGRPSDALEVIQSAPHEIFQSTTTYAPRPLLAGLAFEALGDAARARTSFDSARAILEATLRDLPEDPRVHAQLGLTYAALGMKPEAIAAGRKATELLPESKDAWWGTGYTLRLAEIYTRVGEPDSALSLIEHVLNVPANFTAIDLMRRARWAPLREHPRFEALVGTVAEN